MPRRWYASFKNALGASLVFGAIFWTSAWSAEGEGLLELPEYNVEALEAMEGKSVGDEIPIRFSGGLSVDSVDLPEGSSSFRDLGWQIYKKEVPTPQSEQKIIQWVLSPLKAGDLVLPPVLLRDSAGKSFGRTAPFKARIQTNLDSDKPEPVPPRPPVTVEFPRWLLFLIVSGTLAVIAALIYGIRRWMQKRPVPIEPQWKAPEKTCEQIAMEALQLLENDGWTTPEQVKANAFRLTEILKNYLERKFGFDAPESTTTEILSKLRPSIGPGKMVEDNFVNMAELLVDLDRIKFTDFGATIARGPDLIGRARNWVRAASPLNPMGGPRM